MAAANGCESQAESGRRSGPGALGFAILRAWTSAASLGMGASKVGAGGRAEERNSRMAGSEDGRAEKTGSQWDCTALKMSLSLMYT
eukprot:5029191-Pyramimonas_sp.AAC.1